MDRAANYRTEIDTLFNAWKNKEAFGAIDHRGQVFIRDGVICPERWFAQEIRPMFLLKEAYGGTSDWDLVSDHLLTDKRIRHTTNKRVTKWTYGLLGTTTTNVPAYPVGDDLDYYGNACLQQCAVVNVRKSGGMANSDMDIINAYAEYDKEQLRREIELVDPTIIVCGYTISSLNIIMGRQIKDYDHSSPDQCYPFDLNGHRVIAIDYYHPSNRYPEELNYYGLMGLYQQALKRLQ